MARGTVKMYLSHEFVNIGMYYREQDEFFDTDAPPLGPSRIYPESTLNITGSPGDIIITCPSATVSVTIYVRGARGMDPNYNETFTTDDFNGLSHAVPRDPHNLCSAGFVLSDPWLSAWQRQRGVTARNR